MIEELWIWNNTSKDAKENVCAKAEPKESVNHPDHYKVGDYECIDVNGISLYGKDAVINFCMLNAFKYQVEM